MFGIENEAIIIAMAMTKIIMTTVIMKIIIIIMKTNESKLVIVWKYKRVKTEWKVFKYKQFMSAEKGKTFRKPCFIGTQKSLNVNIKNKVQETKWKR